LVKAALTAAQNSRDELVLPLDAVFQSGAWREFVLPNGEVVRHERLVDFIRTPQNRGLEVDPEVLYALLEKSDYVQSAAALRKAIREAAPPIAGHGGPRTKEQVDGINLTDGSGGGTSAEYILRRLKRDRPELAQKVIDGELTPHAAAVEAGIQRRTARYRVDDPQAAVKSLLKHYTAEQIREALEAQ